MVESAARSLADQFHDELAGLVTGTIQRWDAEQTSSQLELLLGRDLQFIRINGTVVGAGVGLALHAIAMAAGLDASRSGARGRWPCSTVRRTMTRTAPGRSSPGSRPSYFQESSVSNRRPSSGVIETRPRSST